MTFRGPDRDQSAGAARDASTDLGSRIKKKTFYGWWLVAAAMANMAFVSGISFWSYGLYIEPLEDEFGWSRAEASLGFSFALLFGGLFAPVVGKIIDLRGPRFSIVVGSLLTSGGYLLLSTTNALWQWYLFNGLLSVFMQMMFFIPFQALVSRWFDARRGIALSLVDIGFLLGASLLVPVIRFIIDDHGWQAGFIFSALVVALTALPAGVFVVRDSPQIAGQHVDGRPPGGRSALVTAGTGVPLSAALRMPVFWLTAFGFGFFFYGIVGWAVHQVPFWESHGYSRSTATLIIALAAGLGIGFRIVFGLLANRIHRYENAAVVFSLILAFSMVVILVDTRTAGIGLFIVFWIVGSGGVLVEPLLIARSFGITTFATILGSVVLVETATQIASPTLTGLIFDSTGSYDLALVMFAMAFLLASMLFAAAARFRLPLDQYVPGSASSR